MDWALPPHAEAFRLEVREFIARKAGDPDRMSTLEVNPP